MDRPPRRQCTQRVAADVRQHLSAGVVAQGLVEGRVEGVVRAALAERGRAVGQPRQGRGHGRGVRAEAERSAHVVRGQLAVAGERAVQSAGDPLAVRQPVQPRQELFHEGAALFDDQDAVDVLHQRFEPVARDRVRADVQRADLVAVGEVLVYVVGAQAGGDDSQRPAPQRERVELTLLGPLCDLRQAVEQPPVAHPCVRGQQRPLPRVLGQLELVVGSLIGCAHRGPGVGQARHQADDHGHVEALGQVERRRHHVVALLLVAWLQAGDEREARQAPGVLLVL